MGRFVTGLYVRSYKLDHMLAQVWMLSRNGHVENGNMLYPEISPSVSLLAMLNSCATWLRGMA